MPVDIFQALQDALANLIGVSTEIAGFILGAVLIVVMFIIFQWTIETRYTGSAVFLISATIGVVLAVLFGWFPLWVIVFIALLVVYAIFNPLKESEPV